MTGRKTLMEKTRERAWAIHRWHCKSCECLEPTREDRERAAREVTRPPSGLTVGQHQAAMVRRLDGIAAGLWDKYGGTP